jgi:hypothetical protein
LIEYDVRETDDFSGECFEWFSPFLDLRLESGILGGGIVEMDGGAVVGEDFAGGRVRYVDVA